MRSLAAGSVTALCGLALILTPLGTTFERSFGLDWLFKVRGARPPPPDIAIVGINSQTGAALGLPRLPHDWSRAVHARLVEGLVEQNARGIVFDIDFSRPKSATKTPFSHAQLPEPIAWCCSNGWPAEENAWSHQMGVMVAGLGSRLQPPRGIWRCRQKP